MVRDSWTRRRLRGGKKLTTWSTALRVLIARRADRIRRLALVVSRVVRIALALCTLLTRTMLGLRCTVECTVIPKLVALTCILCRPTRVWPLRRTTLTGLLTAMMRMLWRWPILLTTLVRAAAPFDLAGLAIRTRLCGRRDSVRMGLGSLRLVSGTVLTEIWCRITLIRLCRWKVPIWNWFIFLTTSVKLVLLARVNLLIRLLCRTRESTSLALVESNVGVCRGCRILLTWTWGTILVPRRRLELSILMSVCRHGLTVKRARLMPSLLL